MEFDPGFSISATDGKIGFVLGSDCFDRGIEYRKLDSIRKSLKDPGCEGPEDVYAIMMDIGQKADLPAMEQRMLLFGAVTYAAGRLGSEPIRSQGHIHKVSAHCGWSTPEVYEIWDGEAVIYMQETAEDNPGRCYAVYARPGDVVIVPPYWVHATVSANPDRPLTFGAWCDRDYGFEYGGVRKHGGIAWFPLLDKAGGLYWEPNPAYRSDGLICKKPGLYEELGLKKGEPIYRQFAQDPDRFLFVSNPALKKEVWENFVP